MKFGQLLLMIVLTLVVGCRQTPSPTQHQTARDAAPAASVTESSPTPSAPSSTPAAPKQQFPTAEPTPVIKPKEPPRLPPVNPEAQMRLEAMKAEYGGGAALPKNFPKDVPLYPDAEITASGKMATELMINFRTPDHIDQVSQFYQQELPRQGWQLKTVKFPGGFIEAVKGHRLCMISIEADPSGLGLLVNVTATPQ